RMAFGKSKTCGGMPIHRVIDWINHEDGLGRREIFDDRLDTLSAQTSPSQNDGQLLPAILRATTSILILREPCIPNGVQLTPEYSFQPPFFDPVGSLVQGIFQVIGSELVSAEPHRFI